MADRGYREETAMIAENPGDQELRVGHARVLLVGGAPLTLPRFEKIVPLVHAGAIETYVGVVEDYVLGLDSSGQVVRCVLPHHARHRYQMLPRYYLQAVSGRPA